MNRIVGMKESCESRPGGGMNNRAPGTPRGNWGCWKSPERPTLVMLSVAKHLDSAVTYAKTRFFASLRMTQGCGFSTAPLPSCHEKPHWFAVEFRRTEGRSRAKRRGSECLIDRIRIPCIPIPFILLSCQKEKSAAASMLQPEEPKKYAKTG